MINSIYGQESDLRTALLKLTDQSLPYLIECTVVELNESENTCNVRPVYALPDLDKEVGDTIYYNVPYPSRFTPTEGSFCIIGFTDEVTPYVLYTDKIKAVNIGDPTNSASSNRTQTEKNATEKQLLANRGAVFTDGAFRYSLNESGIISVNGTYYGWITINEQSQIEIFKENMNLAVNEAGKIYIGQTQSNKVKEFDIDVLTVNATSPAVDGDPTTVPFTIKQRHDLLEWLITHVNDSIQTFTAAFEEYKEQNSVAVEFIPDASTFGIIAGQSPDYFSNTTDEKRQEVRYNVVNSILAILDSMSAFSKTADRLTNTDYKNISNLVSNQLLRDGLPVAAGSSIPDIFNSDLDRILESLYTYKTHFVDIPKFISLIGLFNEQYRTILTIDRATQWYWAQTRTKIIDIYSDLLAKTEKNKSVSTDIDMIRVNGTQSSSTLNINDILTEIQEAVSDLSAAVNTLATAGVTTLVGPGSLTGLAKFQADLVNVDSKLTGAKSDIDMLFATEQADINIE